jgi:transmembrane sensor
MLGLSRAERIAREADRWVVRESDGLSPDEIVERDAWRAADLAHERAWQKARSVWGLTEGVRRGYHAATKAPPIRFRPAYAFAGVIAAIVAAGGALVLGSHRGSSSDALIADYRTTDAPTQIQLPDGSIVDLAPHSAVHADFAGAARDIAMESGTARFDVVHDASRLFVVHAADREVTDIGTRFEVALRPHGVVVSLFEGAIEVAARTPHPTAKPIRMTVGQQLVVDGDHETVRSVAPGTTAARDGTAPPSVTVGNLIERANATTTVPIRLADPAMARTQVQGAFDTTDTAALAAQLAAALDATLTRVNGTFVLSRP